MMARSTAPSPGLGKHKVGSLQQCSVKVFRRTEVKCLLSQHLRVSATDTLAPRMLSFVFFLTILFWTSLLPRCSSARKCNGHEIRNKRRVAGCHE